MKDSVKREYVHTLTLELIVLSCQVLAFKLAADYWGSLGFSEYALTRRAIALLQPALMLGLGVALPRYAARAVGSAHGSPTGYLHAGALLIGGALFMWLGFLLSWDRLTALVVFGDASYASFMPAVAVMLAGLSAHVVAYGYLRGMLRLRAANWLGLVDLGLIPVLAFLVPNQTVTSLFTHIGLAWLAVAGTVLVRLFQAARRPVPVVPRVRELARYGIPRVPGEFLQVALISVPAILVAHVDGVEAAGRVAFAMSMLSLFGSLFSPIGLVLLPTASTLASAGELSKLAHHVRKLAWRVLGVAVLAAVVIELGAGLAIRAYLGTGFDAMVPLVRLVLIGIVPFALYMTLRSVLDALHERALNTRNLALTATVFGAGLLVSMLANGGTFGILVAVTLAFYVLGALTVRDTAASLRTVAA